MIRAGLLVHLSTNGDRRSNAIIRLQLVGA